jgi:hypothetical protein
VSFGWSRLTFETYYLFGALLTVPVLAAGTLELLASRTVARAYLVALIAFAAASVVLLAAAPIRAADLVGELPEGSQVLPVAVRVLAGVGNGVGTLIVVGGALVTVVGAARADRSAWYRQRRVQGTALIAAGVLVAAAGGSVAAIGRSAGLALALAAGAAVMYAGFRRTSPPRLASEAARQGPRQALP